jgi:hypothetical protein
MSARSLLLVVLALGCGFIGAEIFAAGGAEIFAAGGAVTRAAGGAAAGDKAKTVWGFDDDVPGKGAAGFKTEVGDWTVADLDGGKVLSQTAKNSNSTFNLVLVSDSRAKDLDVSVKMRAHAGDTDQGGGLVWRAQDKKNYYLARYNPLEDNFRLYKVANGKREMFKNADINAEAGWHTLRVTMKGAHIECFMDGKKHLEFDDGTFPEAGMVGLWSKADAQSHFDDLTLVDLD